MVMLPLEMILSYGHTAWMKPLIEPFWLWRPPTFSTLWHRPGLGGSGGGQRQKVECWEHRSAGTLNSFGTLPRAAIVEMFGKKTPWPARPAEISRQGCGWVQPCLSLWL